jgi:hypothetical protein
MQAEDRGGRHADSGRWADSLKQAYGGDEAQVSEGESLLTREFRDEVFH